MIVTVIIVVDVITVLIAVTIFFFWYLIKVCWCVYWNYEVNSQCPVIHERKKKTLYCLTLDQENESDCVKFVL